MSARSRRLALSLALALVVRVRRALKFIIFELERRGLAKHRNEKGAA